MSLFIVTYKVQSLQGIPQNNLSYADENKFLFFVSNSNLELTASVPIVTRSKEIIISIPTAICIV